MNRVIAAMRSISTRPLRYIVNTTEFDDRGRPVVGSDLGDLAAPDDQRCVRTSYDDNAGSYAARQRDPDVVYLSAMEEAKHYVAQANAEIVAKLEDPVSKLVRREKWDELGVSAADVA